MHSFLTESVASVRTYLDRYLSAECTPLLALQPWGPDLQKRIHEYALRGKLIRGALVPFGFRIVRPADAIPEACYHGGVAMELLQSFLLVHDDIMDQDLVRRGGPSIHAQYQDLRGSSTGAHQYGRSMGICGGDVAAFLAVHRIATLPVSDNLRSQLTTLMAREVVTVGLAQMHDVHLGYTYSTTPEEILAVYTHKTGRYTFSLPLMIGAYLAEAAPEQIEALARFGEHAGRIFQIRDDQLGLFGQDTTIGKPAGSDIRENKKTLFRDALLRKLDPDNPVRTYFGSESIGMEEINAVRDEMVNHGVLEEIDRLVAGEEEEARNIIRMLRVPPESVNALEALLAYNNSRVQ